MGGELEYRFNWRYRIIKELFRKSTIEPIVGSKVLILR